MQKNKTSDWLFHIRQWHWVSAALSMVGLLLFAGTGILLNNDTLLRTEPTVTSWEIEMPEHLPPLTEAHNTKKKLPDAWNKWIRKKTGYKLEGQEQEWEDGEIYITLKSPSADASVSIFTEDRVIAFEETDHGMLALLKNLHKGRDTGKEWSWFIDIFGVTCIIFTVTGLFLMIYYQRQRKTTWAVAASGVIVPLMLILLFMHV